MINCIIKPSETLKPYIQYYYVLETDSYSDMNEKQRVYPYGNIILVFHYGQPYLFQKRNKVAEIEPRTVICGQQTTYYDLASAGKIGMIFIVFRPFGAGMFFKMPMHEIADQNIAFEHIVNNEPFEIEDKIQNASSLQNRIEIIENFLLKKLIDNNCDGKRIIAACKKISEMKGHISVTKLADVACLSIKQFERKFSSLVGLNPKQFLKIVRFQNILQMKKDNPNLNYTSLAYASDYYDQSHFINDFKNITGLTPKDFFNKG